MNDQFNTWKFQAQSLLEHVLYTNCFLFWHSEQFVYTTSYESALQCFELGIFVYWTGHSINSLSSCCYWTGNSTNNLLSYCGLVDAGISTPEKDLPDFFQFCGSSNIELESYHCLQFILLSNFLFGRCFSFLYSFKSGNCFTHQKRKFPLLLRKFPRYSRFKTRNNCTKVLNCLFPVNSALKWKYVPAITVQKLKG